VCEIIFDPKEYYMAQAAGSVAVAHEHSGRHRALIKVFLTSASICLFLDQVGKCWAFTGWREPVGIRRLIPGLYAGAQARNYGGMLSLEGHRAPLLQATLTIVGFVALCVCLRRAFVLDRDRWSRFDGVAGGLILAGALGNQLDRLALGYVRDYLFLAVRPTDIFNTADVFMVLGAFLFLGSLLVGRRARSASSCSSAREPAGRHA
jgi:signal peptidase II